MTELITYTIDADHVAVVTMNNPPVNAQNGQFYEEMMQVMDALSDTPACRAIVLIGAGKVFSAGADMRARVAVGIGAGVTITTRGPMRAVSACQLRARAICAALVAP